MPRRQRSLLESGGCKGEEESAEHIWMIHNTGNIGNNFHFCM